MLGNMQKLPHSDFEGSQRPLIVSLQHNVGNKLQCQVLFECLTYL